MKRPSVFLSPPVFAVCLLLAHVCSADTSPGRLESVSIVRGGAGSSLAARTSALAVLVAATSVSTRTVVIELVGIVAEKRDVPITDAAGIISHLAIDTVRPSGGGAVTRIRISLARPYRHRLRMSGQVTYIDFERIAEPESVEVRRRSVERPVKPPVIETTNTGYPRTSPPAATLSSSVDATPPAAPAAQLNLLRAWAAVTQPLQHVSDAPLSASVLENAWMPVVLKDGTMLFSYGDYAEVDGHLAFLLPFDDANHTPRVEPVTLHLSAIDRGATDRAAESVRASRYAVSRGPQEFAELSDGVSAILNAVPSEPNPVARVRLVESVKRRLVEWPATHHGYRAKDVHEAITILDPILSQLRAAAGIDGIELSLAALTETPPARVSVSEPTLVELLENAMRFALLAAPAAMRMAVLRATAESLERHRTALPSVWLEAGQRRVAAALKSESRVDEAYRKLTTSIVERAARAVRTGNVRAITALQSELLERDQLLGRMREDVIASTITVLKTQFDAAAREQLRREREAIDGSPRSQSRP